MMSFFDEVADAAEASNRQTNIFHERISYHPADPTGVFGREAGADYARYIFPSLESYIREESERKAYGLAFHPRVNGPTAREGFADKLQELLPGFEIEWKGSSIEIGWVRSPAD